jgi:dienelactone hydrolase
MYQYFPNNYTWSLAVMSALNRGGQIAEIDEACRSLHEAAGKRALDGDAMAQNAWFESWCKMAERVERLANADEAAGHLLSAGRKLLRVGLYFLLAERMPSHKDPRRPVAYKKGIAAYERGLKLRKEPVEYVQVPYGDTTLPAIFMKAPGGGRRPCMVHFNGLDLTKEIVYSAIADEFRRRGVSLLIVDHPGVGAALRLQGLPTSHESERWATAAMDFLERRADIDAKRVGIVAMSLGGYFAPRAAAFEKRLACCIAWGARWDNALSHGRILKDPNAARSVTGWVEHALHVYGARDAGEAAAKIARMTLEGVAEKIECPLLVVHGENDRQVPLWHAEMTVEKAVNCKDKELKVFTLAEGSAEHCGADNNSLTVDYMADWAAERLGA